MTERVQHHPYAKGQKYRVLVDGCSLLGMRPIHGGFQGWSRPLQKDEIIVCRGEAWTHGDGVPLIKWEAVSKDGIGIVDCEFQPSVGGMWSQRPDSTKLELVEG